MYTFFLFLGYLRSMWCQNSVSLASEIAAEPGWTDVPNFQLVDGSEGYTPKASASVVASMPPMNEAVEIHDCFFRKWATYIIHGGFPNDLPIIHWNSWWIFQRQERHEYLDPGGLGLSAYQGSIFFSETDSTDIRYMIWTDGLGLEHEWTWLYNSIIKATILSYRVLFFVCLFDPVIPKNSLGIFAKILVVTSYIIV